MMQVNIENAFNNVFQATIFRELCDVGGAFGEHCPLSQVVLPCSFFFFTNMGDMWKGSPLLNHFRHEAR